MPEVTPEQRSVLNETLGDIASNIVFRALDALADPPTVDAPEGDQQKRDYDKAIDTAIKVLRFFDFNSMDTAFDEETQKRVDELKRRLPNRRRKKREQQT